MFGIHIIKREWSDDNKVFSGGTTHFLQNHFIASCSASVWKRKTSDEPQIGLIAETEIIEMMRGLTAGVIS